MQSTVTLSLSIVVALGLLALESSCVGAFVPSCAISRQCPSRSRLMMSSESYQDDDDDIDVDSLGDWRAFRKNLAQSENTETPTTTKRKKQKRSKENESLLMKQNKKLGQEYASGVWAHETSTPEVGGLVCRLPLEAEIYRNYRHNLIGQMLRKRLGIAKDKPKQPRPSSFFEDADNDDDFVQESKLETLKWYGAAQKLVSEQMQAIASTADGGSVDASKLGPESSALIQLFIDNQETWQEVCLVLERDEAAGTATTVALNRPMARKLTPNLAQLVLNGVYKSSNNSAQDKKDLVKFIMAFGKDIAVYAGGPDGQDRPATLVHGIKDLEGAVEISPGSNIYRGGIDAAMDGVLEGKYNPLDFRFFVGRHEYTSSQLDVAVVLGKYQPVACARSLSLKQCIALPKPLWHEVLELCGGELGEISAIELMKRDDLKIEVVEDDYDIVDDDEEYNRK